MAWHLRALKIAGWSSLVAAALVVALVGGLLLAGMALYSKAHPLDVTPYLPRVQAFLTPMGLQISAEKAEVFFDGSPIIRVRDFRLAGAPPAPGLPPTLAVVAEDIAVKLANRRLFLLQASPKVVEAKNVTLRLVNTANGVTVAGLRPSRPAETSMATAATTGALEWLNGMDASSLWARLKGLRVQGLTLLLKDEPHGTQWVMSDGVLNLTRYPNDGEEGTLTATVRRLEDTEEQAVPVLVRFSHPAGSETATVASRLKDVDMTMVASYLPPQMKDLLQAQGEVELGTQLLPGNRLGQPWVTLRLGKVALLPPKGYAKPMEFAKLALTASYIPKVAGVSGTDVLTLRDVEAVTARGNVFHVSGTVADVTTDPMVRIDAQSPGGDVQGIFDFFPDADPDFQEANAFVRPNIISATYANLTGHYYGKPSAFPGCGDACGDIGGQATLTSGRVKYVPELPPADIITTTLFTWKGQQFDITAPVAKVGPHTATSLTVELNNLFAVSPTHVVVKGVVSGPLNALMIDLAKMDKTIPTGLEGTALAGLYIDVPLPAGVSTTFDMMTVLVNGTVKNATVKGLTELQGDVFKTPLAVVTLDAPKNLRVQATGQLAGARGSSAVKADVQLNIQPGLPTPLKVGLTGTFSGPAVWAHLGRPEAVSLTGPVVGAINLLQRPDKTLAFGARADATGARVSVADLNYIKPAGESLLVETQGTLSPKDVITLTNLKVTGKRANISGKVTIDPAALDDMTVQLNPFVLGQTRASVSIAKRRAVIMGDVLDLSGLDMATKTDAQHPSRLKNMVASLKVKSMPTHNGRFEKVSANLKQMRGHWDVQQFVATVNGTSRVVIATTPLGLQKSRMDITVEDLGATLSGLGLYDKLKGGQMWGEILYDTPTSGAGTLKIKDFELKNPPILMKLLGLMSLQQLVAGTDATLFDRATLPVKLKGDKVTLEKAVLEGPSMSLRLDGTYDRDSQTMNFDGRLAPAIPFNRLVGKIPVVGTILTGSQDGVVVADFKLRGTAEKQDIDVRPLSVITPGLVKDFWRGLTDVLSGPAKEEGTEAPVKPAAKSSAKSSGAGKTRGAK